MLRLIALALLLANLVYFVWTLGWIDGLVGIRADGDRDPQRLQRQLRPDLVQLSPAEPTRPAAPPAAAIPADAAASMAALPASQPAARAAPASAPVVAAAMPKAAASAAAGVASAAASTGPPAPAARAASAAPAAVPPVSTAAASAGSAPASPSGGASDAAAGIRFSCLEAGPFAAAEVAAAEAAIRAAAPLASWSQRRVAGGEWMIYMGPYPEPAAVERKKGELSRIRGGLPHEVVGPTPLFGLGISLGRFASKAEAERQLELLRPRGIRTARVIPSGDGPARTVLRVAKADPSLAERLSGIEWPAGQAAGFKPCAAQR